MRKMNKNIAEKIVSKLNTNSLEEILRVLNEFSNHEKNQDETIAVCEQMIMSELSKRVNDPQGAIIAIGDYQIGIRVIPYPDSSETVIQITCNYGEYETISYSLKKSIISSCISDTKPNIY